MISRKTLTRVILIPFLLHWTWWLYHYTSVMLQIMGQGWRTAPTVYLVVQSWMLLSEIMVMTILLLIALTFKDKGG